MENFIEIYGLPGLIILVFIEFGRRFLNIFENKLERVANNQQEIVEKVDNTNDELKNALIVLANSQAESNRREFDMQESRHRFELEREKRFAEENKKRDEILAKIGTAISEFQTEYNTRNDELRRNVNVSAIQSGNIIQELNDLKSISVRVRDNTEGIVTELENLRTILDVSVDAGINRIINTIMMECDNGKPESEKIPE